MTLNDEKFKKKKKKKYISLSLLVSSSLL